MRIAPEGAFPFPILLKEGMQHGDKVVYLQNLVARLRERQEGQTMAEYALILGGIAVVVIAGILILGPAIRDLFQSTGSSVQNFPSS